MILRQAQRIYHLHSVYIMYCHIIFDRHIPEASAAYTQTHHRLCTCTCTRTRTRTHTSAHMCKHNRSQARWKESLDRTWGLGRGDIYIHTHIHTYIHIYIHIHMYIYMYMDIYMHTYIPLSRTWSLGLESLLECRT